MKRDSPAPAPLTRRDWTWLGGVVAVVVLIFLRLVTWHLAVEHSVGRHLTPRAEHLEVAGLIGAPLVPVLVLLGMALRQRPVKRLVLALVGVTVLAALGSGGYAYWTLELFEPTHKATVLSPDGTHEAHLYVGGLLGCDAHVYVSERGAMWGDEVARRPVECNEAYDAAWLPDGGVEIHGTAPKPWLFGH